MVRHGNLGHRPRNVFPYELGPLKEKETAGSVLLQREKLSGLSVSEIESLKLTEKTQYFMCLGTRRCNALNDGQKSPPLMSKAYTCKKKHWHSEIHGGERFKLIISIVKRVIRRHKPQTLRNVKWQELFPRVIVKVDAILYSAACSLVCLTS